MAATEQWSLQVRPIDGLTAAGLAAKPWIRDLDLKNDGINIALTDFVDSTAFTSFTTQANVWDDIKALAKYLRQYSEGRTWDTTSEGVLTPPQRSVTTGQASATWYLNLCCFQETLGQICALLNAKYYDSLKPFALTVFPNVVNLVLPPDPDALGAYFIRLQPSVMAFPGFNDADAAVWRARIKHELNTWALCLVKKTVATGAVTVIEPLTIGDAADAQLFRPLPALMFLPSLAPPNAAACDEANARPRGPFSPGPCAPRGSCGTPCYFPYKGYPDCCFSRAYRIRARC